MSTGSEPLDLKRLIVDNIVLHDNAGGIRIYGLTNNIAARYWAEKQQPPTDDDIETAVFELLSTDVIRVVDNKLRTAKISGKAQGQNPSGIWPIGPGDPIFNRHGVEIGKVIGLRKNTITMPAATGSMGSKMKVVSLAVQAGFRDVQMDDGMVVPGDWEFGTIK